MKGALTNAELDSGPVFAVRGTLRAERWWLTGAEACIWGDLAIERLLITEYNHGSLRVEGKVMAPVVIVHGHRTELIRGLAEGVLFEDLSEAAEALDPACSKGGRLELVAVWERAAANLPLLRPRAAAPAREPRVDDLYVYAKALVEDWLAEGKVILVASVNVDDFVDVVAQALEGFRNHADPAAALGEWLLERPEVEEVVADDAELVRIRS